MKAKLITRTIQTLAPTSTPYDVRDTELSGFLLRVLPTGQMNYFCDFRRPDGRRTRLKLGDTRVLTPAQARDEALKVLGDLARGQDPVAARRAARQDTLETFIGKHYAPWAKAHRKTGEEAVNRALTTFKEFKNSRLSDISPWKFEKWRASRLKSGTKATTINREAAILKVILQKAVEWECIESNPLAAVRPLKTDSAAKVRYLSPEEELALRSSLDRREARIREDRRSHNVWCLDRGYRPFPSLDKSQFGDHLKPMVLISLNTGIRRGELFNLKWEDIDFQRRTLTVVGATAKSGKTRHIPLNREALETLTAWRAQSEPESELVFVGRTGRFDNTRTSWEGVLSDAKISVFRWHDMRHHFASMLVMRGVDLNTVRELLGHADLKMTLRYAHLAPQVKAAAVAKLDQPALACVPLKSTPSRQ